MKKSLITYPMLYSLRDANIFEIIVKRNDLFNKTM